VTGDTGKSEGTKAERKKEREGVKKRHEKESERACVREGHR
jgi:hypothetical protein